MLISNFETITESRRMCYVYESANSGNRRFYSFTIMFFDRFSFPARGPWAWHRGRYSRICVVYMTICKCIYPARFLRVYFIVFVGFCTWTWRDICRSRWKECCSHLRTWKRIFLLRDWEWSEHQSIEQTSMRVGSFLLLAVFLLLAFAYKWVCHTTSAPYMSHLPSLRAVMSHAPSSVLSAHPKQRTTQATDEFSRILLFGKWSRQRFWGAKACCGLENVEAPGSAGSHELSRA